MVDMFFHDIRDYSTLETGKDLAFGHAPPL